MLRDKMARVDLLLYICFQGAESISKLLEEAKSYVPKDQWSKTPLALKATAGLRQLPEKKANDLLNEVQSLFSTA